MTIEVRRDRVRGCGWRKPGGLYLVADGVLASCGKLPIPLDVCPVCHAGIKPSRGWTWVNGDALLASRTCALDGTRCRVCPMNTPDVGMVGLLWVGGQFYKTPRDWLLEADRQGVSRRIAAVPVNFVLGETWVFVAHREALPLGRDTFQAAIFHAFKPTAIEYVVKGKETKKQLQALVARGITPVRVERVESEPTFPEIHHVEVNPTTH